jgi:tetratricopeptide (TPR) repeat protein
MKILLFNLGPIHHRILSWDLEGFKSLFEQDIILWGPVPDEKFIYENKEIPILRIFEPTSINAVFDRLPADWYPDVVTCETSVLSYIPDIYLCPVKTILFTRDAWSDTVFNRNLVQLFDFLNHATIDRSLFKAYNVNLLPLSNSAVTLPRTNSGISEFEKREFDVIAIANYDGSFYHDRFKTLYKLAHANKSGINIKYFRGIDRSEIYLYYQRSKIVIDWAHTLSNRSYEAALNGCLLFSHKDNQLIKDFWIPWEEYIPYDETNVLELVKYYIENPGQSRQIIKRAKEKSLSIPTSWGDYVLQNIQIAVDTDVSIEERIKRVESIPPSTLHHSCATALLYNYEYNTSFPPDWKNLYFKRIDNAISSASDQYSGIAPLIEAARMAFLLKKSTSAGKYLDDLQKVIPDYGWIYYMQARICNKEGENDKALLLLQEAIQCGSESPESLQRYVLPVIEKKNACDNRRITDYMWQSVLNHNNEFQVKSLMYLSFELCGDIYTLKDKPDKALNAYREAIKNVPLAACIFKADDLLMKSMNFSEISEITGKGIDNSPYESLLIFYKAYALIRLNQSLAGFAVLREHRKALESFLGVRRIVIIRKLISLVLLFRLFGKQPASIIIVKIISELKKKMRVTYFNF